MNQENGFFVTPFGIDGYPVGSGFWEYSKLSEHWLSVCQQVSSTATSDAPFSGKLSHIRLKWTSATGAAIGTFLVNDKVVCSVLLLTGRSHPSESQVAQMFVESLRRNDTVRIAAGDAKPFEAILTANERPMMVVVTWPQESVSAPDTTLVRELAIHLAGAFFSRSARTEAGFPE